MAKVKLDKEVKTIEAFYDAECGICCTFMDWLNKQNRACELVCLGYQSDEAQEVFPELLNYEPDKVMVVRVDADTDDPKIYQGGEAWVCCLWSCTRYRWLAKIVNNRLLLPIAKKICYFVSRNRLGISRLFFRKKDTKIECDGGCEK